MNKQGITKTNNFSKEEITYSIGSKGHMPIALALLLSSGYENIIARYFNQLTYSKKANEWQSIVLSDKLEVPEKFIDDFEGKNKDLKPVSEIFEFKPVSKDWLEREQNPPHDTPLPFHIYGQELAKMICMKTPQYMTKSESIIMTCPMSHIKFWNRNELKAPMQAVEHAIEHILGEVVRVLKLRGMIFNEEAMTIPIPQYKGYVFVYGYGW